jgi:hypothetical protein
MANSVKYWSDDFTGLEKTLLYSVGFFNRNVGGKLKDSSVTISATKQLIWRGLLPDGH